MRLPNPPDLNNLSHIIIKLVQLLRDTSRETLNFKNEFFENIINLINDNRIELHSIAIETIFHINSLIRFGEDLIIFVEICGDESVSDEEKVDLLNLLLKDAKKNNTALKNIKSKVKSVMNSILDAYRKLAVLFKNWKNIDPNTYYELEKTKSSIRYCDVISTTIVVLNIIALAGLAGLKHYMASTKEVKVFGRRFPPWATNIARMIRIGTEVPTATAELAAKVADIIATILFVVCIIIIIGTTLVARNKKKDAVILEQTLVRRERQVNNKSNNVQDNVILIHHFLNVLEDFWNNHIIELERLIDYFESSSENNSPPSQLVIEQFEKRWKESIRKCKEYSCSMNIEISKDVENLGQRNRNNRLIQ